MDTETTPVYVPCTGGIYWFYASEALDLAEWAELSLNGEGDSIDPDERGKVREVLNRVTFALITAGFHSEVSRARGRPIALAFGPEQWAERFNRYLLGGAEE